MSDQFDLNKFNDFLDSATKAISCDAKCQQNKKREDLKNKYLVAQSNLDLAEPQYQVAKKNYYTYTSGVSGYNEMLEGELTQEADLFTNSFKQIYNEEISKITTQINTYDGILVNFRNIVDLYKTYKRENEKLYGELKDKSNDVLTNERKTYYEDQSIGNLNLYYYYFLLIIYYVIIIMFIIFKILNYPSQYSLMSQIFIFVFFGLLPFVSTWILGKIIQILYWLFSLLPKNVYK